MQDSKPIEQLLIEKEVDWRAWPIVGPPKISKQFSEGLNHQTLMLEASGQTYVLKIFDSASPSAITAQRWAAKRGLAPNVIYAPNDGRYLLMDFISHESLQEPFNDDHLNAIAIKLRQLHKFEIDQIAIACGYFNFSAFCDFYLKNCDSPTRDVHAQLQAALKPFTDDKTALSFCHNDLVKSNCLIQRSEVLLIDWEYALINNPWFDLASIIYYGQLSSKQSLLFLSTYDSNFRTHFQQPIFYSAQCAVLWLDILWHKVKFGEKQDSKLQEKYSDLDQLAKALNVDLRLNS